ncbi:MAG: hypothetical protein WA208_08570 [Thermoanaerobaculia bacterium]
MKRELLCVFSFLCCALIALPGTAQDVDDHQGVSNILGAGARAWAMGGAFIALADDATAASWNPAGLAQLVRPETSLAFDTGRGDIEWRYRYASRTAQGTETLESIRDTGKTDFSGVAFASATWPFRPRGHLLVGQLSYRKLSTFPGILNPYVTRTTISAPDGALVSTTENANVFETSYGGGFDSFGVSLAGRVTPKLSVGVTANAISGDVSSETIVSESAGALTRSAEMGMTYRFSGLAFDVGVLYRPIEKVSLGAVYHSGFTAPFWYESTLDSPGWPQLRHGGHARMKWPDGFGAGVAFKPTDYLTISMDGAVTHWAAATVDEVISSQLSYDAQDGWKPEFLERQDLGFPYFGVRQRDTTNLRLGAEYVTFYHDVTFPFRVGLFREEQATNAWDTAEDLQPQPRYSGYTAGFGIAVGRVQVDLAYVRTHGTDRGRIGVVDGQLTTEVEESTVRNQRLILSALVRF